LPKRSDLILILETGSNYMDTRVEAIRNDGKVGNSTCSSLSECYSDEDITMLLDDSGVTSAKAAIKWAHEFESIWQDRVEDVRREIF